MASNDVAAFDLAFRGSSEDNADNESEVREESPINMA